MNKNIFSKAIELKKQGIAAYKKKEWAKAYDFYTQALDITKNEITIWEKLDELITTGNNNHTSEVLPGELYDLKRFEIFENIARLNPENDSTMYEEADYYDLYYDLFRIIVKVGRTEGKWNTDFKNKAIEALRKALDLRSNNKDFYEMEATAAGLDVKELFIE